MTNTRRFFTFSQKLDLYVSATGRCRSCSKPLEKGWHAHHRLPYGRGGRTNIDNGDALCPECHLKEQKK
jgi:5-methylcytosine-specific restriction endonuclease McrA